MKIVVLDGYTLNPGDLSWDRLAAMGELEVYERSSIEETIERAIGATIIFTNKAIVDKSVIDQLPDLRYVGVFATGYNIVDTDAAKQRGIVVCNVPGYSTDSVVQLVFSLILEHFNKVSLHNQAVKAGEWVNSRDFSFTKSALTEISGKTIGILGFGSIGRKVADVANAFGMKVIAHSRTRSDQQSTENFSWVEKDTLFRTADIISIHTPLTDQTKNMINAESIELMKPGVFIVNTARGPIVNEDDLAAALNTGRVGGAGLDVLSKEPPGPENPLLIAENCIVTPHIAWATKEARSRLMEISVSNLSSYLNGNPVNRVV